MISLGPGSNSPPALVLDATRQSRTTTTAMTIGNESPGCTVTSPRHSRAAEAPVPTPFLHGRLAGRPSARFAVYGYRLHARMAASRPMVQVACTLTALFGRALSARCAGIYPSRAESQAWRDKAKLPSLSTWLFFAHPGTTDQDNGTDRCTTYYYYVLPSSMGHGMGSEVLRFVGRKSLLSGC